MGRASNARGINMFSQGIMQWAMQKQAAKQQEAQAQLALEKRQQDMDWWKTQLQMQQDKEVAVAKEKDKISDENVATANKRADALKRQQNIENRIADTKAKRAYLADQEKVGTVTPLKGLPGKATVYMGKGTHSVQSISNIKNKTRTRAQLTIDAAKGDKEAQGYIETLADKDVALARRRGSAVQVGKMEALESRMDLDGLARSIIAGKEKFSSAKNTMGVPVTELLRKRILALDPNFNFVKPEVTVKGVSASILQQQKQRGAAGSFVKNIDAQVDRVTEIMGDLSKIHRLGARVLDIPRRKLLRSVKGSGLENVVEAYNMEISREIGKLSTGSQASVKELSVEAQEKWDKIHDPNLSLNELTKVLKETKHMAVLRIKSMEEELEESMSLLDDINNPKRTPTQKPNFKIISVE